VDPLLAWRKEFPILSHTTYMISHSLGAMPKRTEQALAEFAEVWASRGIRAWDEGWWDMPITTGDLIGAIIGAGPGEVVMQQNVSICQWIVTSCFDWRGPRNKLVTDGLNFPSNDYIYHGLKRLGAGCVPLSQRDAERSGDVLGAQRVRDCGRDRGAGDPREVGEADAGADRVGRRGGADGAHLPRSEAARGRGDNRCAERQGSDGGAGAAGGVGRLPAAGGYTDSAALLHE
jgi:hypothetical protein